MRRGVWHPLSCLLKASFFPSSLLPVQLTADISTGPALLLCAYFTELLRGSQKLKPEGVNRLFFCFVTNGGISKAEEGGKTKVCMRIAECGLWVHVHLLKLQLNKLLRRGIHILQHSILYARQRRGSVCVKQISP